MGPEANGRIRRRTVAWLDMHAVNPSVALLPVSRVVDQPPKGISRAAALAVAVALVSVIGWFDYVTGDYSLAVFYLIPVGFATWYAGRASGWFIGLLSAGAWLAGDLALSYPSGQPLMPYWNAAMLALSYGIVTELLSSLRRFQRELEKRVADRTAALAEANEELDAARMHLIEADKLESIGRLAAGVAHEVKNPLMTIMMATDFLSEVILPNDGDARAMIDSLHEAVERANRVICEMLDFARPGALHLQPDSFRLVAERALGLMKHEMARHHIRVVRDWCATASEFPLDRNKMEQVLVNVLLNAIQAMPEGGTITFQTRLSGPEFVAEIDDTGKGISAAHQIRLFEPFFTTKPVGQGTGLGLSVARQIIQLHGGTLGLANRPGGGARVTIRIPLTNKTNS